MLGSSKHSSFSLSLSHTHTHTHTHTHARERVPWVKSSKFGLLSGAHYCMVGSFKHSEMYCVEENVSTFILLSYSCSFLFFFLGNILTA